MSRLSALIAAVVMAVAVTVAVAPAAGAQTSSADEFGTAWTQASCEARGGTFSSSECSGFIGDGASKAVDGDDPGDALGQIQDRAIEWTPTVITIFGTILAFGFAMVLLALGVRKALSKLTMLVRKS